MKFKEVKKRVYENMEKKYLNFDAGMDRDKINKRISFLIKEAIKETFKLMK